MEKSKIRLRLGTAILAVFLLATTILVSSHAHAGTVPEKSDTCATCHLLPKGLQWLDENSGPPLPIAQIFSTSLPPYSAPYGTETLVSVLIRGPPTLG